MTETKRTAAEIRAYCEAASKDWRRGDGRRQIVGLFEGEQMHLGGMGGRSWSGIAGSEGEKKTTRYREQTQHNIVFAVNARTDMPRLLDAAVKRGVVLDKLLAALGRIVKEPMPGLDDAWDRAEKVQAETAWLAESESGEGEG